jgi:Tol biopolymer transport system component
MRRRSFLVVAGTAAICNWKGSGQTSLGTLVWVQPDGLWVRVLPDGRAAKIASGNWLHDPRFSPSGRWISYTDADGKQFVIRADGSSPVSFDAEKTVWLPHDRLGVAYEHKTHVMSSTDGWKSPVTVWKNEGLPLYDPGGDQYARVELHERPPDEYGLNRDKTELYIAPAAEPERKSRVLIPENEGAIQLFGWAHDGKALVYWRADEWSGSLWSDGVNLYAIPVSGGGERKLGIETLAHEDMLDLAPNGNLLAVTRSSGRETWTDQRLTVVDLDAGSMRDLTAATVSALCPAWSPDGGTIAYTAAPDAGNLGGGERAHQNLQLRKIWLIDATGGSAPRQITNDPHYRDEEPMWSRDGSHILFGRMDFNGDASLWLMKSDGTQAQHISAVQVYDDMGLEDNWFGYYGYIDWRSAFDWRR